MPWHWSAELRPSFSSKPTSSPGSQSRKKIPGCTRRPTACWPISSAPPCRRAGRARTNKSTITGAGILRQWLELLPTLVCRGATCVLNLILLSCACFMRALRSQTQGEVLMSGQVILYFDDQADALRFALAAGSVMSGDGTRATDDLVQETTRVTRIRLDAANKGKGKQPNPPERVA